MTLHSFLFFSLPSFLFWAMNLGVGRSQWVSRPFRAGLWAEEGELWEQELRSLGLTRTLLFTRLSS